jgi:sphinganine-1-phosphate aldolase
MIALYTSIACGILFMVNLIWNLVFHRKRTLLSMPYIGYKIKKTLNKHSQELENSDQTKYHNINYIPEKGLPECEVDNLINEMTPQKVHNLNKISGVIYHGGKKHIEKLNKIANMFAVSNPLHPNLFPEIKEMETDIINMTRSLYKGSSNCCGNVTYGGTESLLLACITYRDYCKYNNGIEYPNIIAFESVHPAIDKACHYFGIKLKKAPVNGSGTGSVSDIHNLIDNNTILIVGSAPSYSHGIIDPIKEMANLALQYDIGFHMDACMGGFLIPFIPEFEHLNFTLPGITSISMDTHKYGYSLKGTSVLLFNDAKIKKFQHYINKDWSGGVYATPTMMGSKSGSLIAAAWASMLYIGRDEYTNIASSIRNNLIEIRKGVSYNQWIDIIGDPNLNILAFKSSKLNIYYVINEMKKSGWDLSVMQNPPAFHLCITRLHDNETCIKFCNDLYTSCAKVFKKYYQNQNNRPNEKDLSGTLALYGSSQGVKDSMFIDEIIHDYIFLLSNKSISWRYDV